MFARLFHLPMGDVYLNVYLKCSIYHGWPLTLQLCAGIKYALLLRRARTLEGAETTSIRRECAAMTKAMTRFRREPCLFWYHRIILVRLFEDPRE